MLNWLKQNWKSKLATVAVTTGAWAASTLIPAGAVVVLGPLSIPIAGAVTGAIALAGAAGILPSPTLIKVLDKFTVKR